METQSETNPKSALKAKLRQISEELMKSSNKRIKLETNLEYSIENVKNSQSTELTASSFIKKSTNTYFTPFKAASEVLSNPEFSEFKESFSKGMLVGEKCPSINNVKKVFEEVETNVELETGKVYLIDFWATWCGPCQKPMQHNQDLLVSNKDVWADKVKIIGISLDDTKEEIVERVNSKGWTSIDHYAILGWNQNHKTMKQFVIRGIPKVVLVDKFGFINYIGHPSNINLEARINELISQETQVVYSKTDYQNLKNFINSAELTNLVIKNMDHIDSLEIRASNVSYVSVFNHKMETLYHQPQITIQFEEKNKEKLLPLIDLLKTQNGKLKITVVNFKLALKETKEILGNLFKAHNLPLKEFEAKQTHTLINVNQENGENIEINKCTTDIRDISINPKFKDSLKALEKDLAGIISNTENEYLKDFLSKISFSSTIGKGDEFVPLTVFDIFNEDKEVALESIEGKITLIDFWATWCGPCQGPMQHNQDMIIKNKETWGDKVQFIGISLDDGSEEIKTKVTDKNWTGLTHYRINRAKSNLDAYGVRGIPHFVIFDCHGKLVKVGHPASIKIEEVVNNLLENKCEETEEKATEDSKVFSKHNFKELIKNFGKIDVKDVKSSLLWEGHLYIPEVKLDCCKKYKLSLTGEKDHKNYTSKLVIKARETDYENHIKNLIEKVKVENIEETIELFKICNVTFGVECNSCNTKFEQFQEQFHSVVTGKYYCYNCASKVDSEKKGSESLIEPNNLVYINVKNDSVMKNGFEEYRLGKNRTFTENVQDVGGSCDSCGCGIDQTIRYICLSCKPGPLPRGGYCDLCGGCVEKSRTDSEEGKNVKSACLKKGHDFDTHLLYRIYFGDNYYSF